MKWEIFKISILSIVLVGCSSDFVDSDLVDSRSSDLEMTRIEEAKSLCCPVGMLENMSPEIKQRRKYALMLSNYLVVKDNLYSIEINREDALKLGIPYTEYDRQINNMELINQAIINKALSKEKKGATFLGGILADSMDINNPNRTREADFPFDNWNFTVLYDSYPMIAGHSGMFDFYMLDEVQGCNFFPPRIESSVCFRCYSMDLVVSEFCCRVINSTSRICYYDYGIGNIREPAVITLLCPVSEYNVMFDVVTNCIVEAIQYGSGAPESSTMGGYCEWDAY